MAIEAVAHVTVSLVAVVLGGGHSLSYWEDGVLGLVFTFRAQSLVFLQCLYVQSPPLACLCHFLTWDIDK